MLNAGDFKEKIKIYKLPRETDKDGFVRNAEVPVLVCELYARMRPTRGYSLMMNNSDFSKAYINFEVRYHPKLKMINPGDLIETRRNNIKYKIEYITNADDSYKLIEMQCKAVEFNGKFYV